MTYDSYGNVVDQTNPAVSTRYQFTGREFDEETGLHYYRARYYDAIVGRFLSEDPIEVIAAGWNLFRYVENDPIRQTDPSGNTPASEVLKAQINDTKRQLDDKYRELEQLYVIRKDTRCPKEFGKKIAGKKSKITALRNKLSLLYEPLVYMDPSSAKDVFEDTIKYRDLDEKMKNTELGLPPQKSPLDSLRDATQDAFNRAASKTNGR